MKLIVPPDTFVIVVPKDKEWGGHNFKLIQTTRMNEFDSSEIIIDPVSKTCTHYAPNAQKFGVSYAISGYYGFVKEGYCMLVEGHNVFVERPHLEAVA